MPSTRNGTHDPATWIAAWISSAQPVWGDELPFPNNAPTHLEDQTLCQHVRLSLGGTRLRLVFSNEYGDQPLRLGSVGIALRNQTREALPVTFRGKTQADIPAGGALTSDAMTFGIDSCAELSVRVHLPNAVSIQTFHWDARQTSHIRPGNQVLSNDGGEAIETTTRMLLSAVLVDADETTSVVVVIGDSLVDGNAVAIDHHGRWTDYLAERLAPQGVAVVNAGQSGSRLLKDGIGISTLARFERDVLGVPGVGLGIVSIGLNDLGWAGTSLDTDAPVPSAQALIGGYRTLLAEARQRGIPLIGTTITPFKGAFAGSPFESFYSTAKDEIRQEVNAWIRSSGEFAAVVDLDKLLCDPNDDLRLRSEWDSGDGLHPGDGGNRAIAHAVPIDTIMSLLRR